MASVNRVTIIDMYKKEMSLKEISMSTGFSYNKVRLIILDSGSMRTRKEASAIAASMGKFSHLKGKTRVFSDAWKKNISEGRKRWANEFAVGLSLKPNGYFEHTRGEHKGRYAHCVIAEKKIGRKLLAGEVVHHVDENKTNNEPGNLQVMTRSEHARLHAKENYKNRTIDKKGRFT